MNKQKKVHPLKRTRRNRTIYELYSRRNDRGERVYPATQIARDYGITRTRVYQIVDQFIERKGGVKNVYKEQAEYLIVENERLLSLLRRNGIFPGD